MKNLKLFPKMFIQTFSILAVLVVLVHIFVYMIFPRTYLQNRKQEIAIKADEIARIMDSKDLASIEEYLMLYSKSGEIKAFIKGKNKSNELEIKESLDIDKTSNNNSLIIEQRKVKLDSGDDAHIFFISNTDMQRDAKNLSLKFLPYSLAISFLISIIISLIYAKSISKNIREIKSITDKMIGLDRKAMLKVDSTNEVGQLKEQINNLYRSLLDLIDDLEVKNQEIIRLEKMKYDFFRGASHELKTPLASLKIILENMLYKIGKYKNRDEYIKSCIVIVDDLTHNISQILSLSSLENLKNDEEKIKLKGVLDEIVENYRLLANQKDLTINNLILDEDIYMGKTGLKLVLSNIIGNAVKYTDEKGLINIGIEDEWLYVENSFDIKDNSHIDKLFNINFDLNKENSNGLGLYIVKNILENYGIEYKFIKTKIGLGFFIKLKNN